MVLFLLYGFLTLSILYLQVEGMLSWIRDQRTKNREKREQLKSFETREVAYTYRYTSRHLIPTLQSITMTELRITCPLLYMQE